LLDRQNGQWHAERTISDRLTLPDSSYVFKWMELNRSAGEVPDIETVSSHQCLYQMQTIGRSTFESGCADGFFRTGPANIVQRWQIERIGESVYESLQRQGRALKRSLPTFI
jgi:hypothetical protein